MVSLGAITGQDSPGTQRLSFLRRSAAPVLGIWAPFLAAGLVLAGFVAPWTAGVGVFSGRFFSGFELARLIRDYSGDAPILSLRPAAVALYVLPASALNAALVSAFGNLFGLSRAQRAAFSLAAGAYGCLVFGIALFVTLAGVAGVEDVLHGPRVGLFLGLTGSLAFLLAGAFGAVRRSRGGTTTPVARALT